MERQDSIKGGHCSVGWTRVCRPLAQGGLGIHDLEIMGWALNIRWLWLKKTQPNRPWAEFEVRTHPMAAALFAASMCSVVGNGTSTMFWSDNWLNGMSLTQIAPALSTRISIRIKKKKQSSRLWRSIDGFKTSLVVYQYRLFWNSSWSGIYYRKFISSLRFLINTDGCQHLQESTLRNLHMSISLLVQYPLSQPIGSGRAGFHLGVNVLFGWPPSIDVGLLIVLHSLAQRGMDHPEMSAMRPGTGNSSAHSCILCIC